MRCQGFGTCQVLWMTTGKVAACMMDRDLIRIFSAQKAGERSRSRGQWLWKLSSISTLMETSVQLRSDHAFWDHEVWVNPLCWNVSNIMNPWLDIFQYEDTIVVLELTIYRSKLHERSPLVSPLVEPLDHVKVFRKRVLTWILISIYWNFPNN